MATPMRLEVVLHSLRSAVPAPRSQRQHAGEAATRAQRRSASAAGVAGMGAAAGIGSAFWAQASTRMTRKSLTLVWVGPRTMSPPAASKKLVASLLSRNFWASRWRAPAKRGRVDHGAGRIRHLARAAVDAVGVGGQRRNARLPRRAPAPAPAHIPGCARRGPCALRTVTDSSPPLRMAIRRPAALASRASLAWALGHLARLAGDGIAEIDHLVAAAPGQSPRRPQARRPAWR